MILKFVPDQLGKKLASAGQVRRPSTEFGFAQAPAQVVCSRFSRGDNGSRFRPGGTTIGHPPASFVGAAASFLAGPIALRAMAAFFQPLGGYNSRQPPSFRLALHPTFCCLRFASLRFTWISFLHSECPSRRVPFTFAARS